MQRGPPRQAIVQIGHDFQPKPQLARVEDQLFDKFPVKRECYEEFIHKMCKGYGTQIA